MMSKGTSAFTIGVLVVLVAVAPPYLQEAITFLDPAESTRCARRFASFAQTEAQGPSWFHRAVDLSNSLLGLRGPEVTGPRVSFEGVLRSNGVTRMRVPSCNKVKRCSAGARLRELVLPFGD